MASWGLLSSWNHRIHEKTNRSSPTCNRPDFILILNFNYFYRFVADITDTGVYTCVAENDLGVDRKDVKVSVKGNSLHHFCFKIFQQNLPLKISSITKTCPPLQGIKKRELLFIHLLTKVKSVFPVMYIWTSLLGKYLLSEESNRRWYNPLSLVDPRVVTRCFIIYQNLK